MKYNFTAIARQLKTRLLETKTELGELTEDATSIDRDTQYAMTQLKRCESYLALCILTHKNATKTLAKLKQKHKVKS